MSGVSNATDDTFPSLPTVHPVRQSSVVLPASQRVRTKKPVSREANKPYQRKKPAQRAHTAETESSTDAGRNALMPKGSSNLRQLPSMILASRTQYFSTLLCALCASEKPFDDFQKFSPVFLKNSRTAFESVWPHLKIRVETDDVLFNIVSLSSQIKFIALIIWCIGLSTGNREAWKGSRHREGVHPGSLRVPALFSGRHY